MATILVIWQSPIIILPGMSLVYALLTVSVVTQVLEVLWVFAAPIK